MKKFLSVLLILAMSLSLVSCSVSDKPVEDDEEPYVDEGIKSEKGGLSEVWGRLDGGIDYSRQESVLDAPAKPEGPIPTIEKQVLFNCDEARVTALSIDNQVAGRASMRILVENFTDRPLTFSCYDSVVNGFMVSCFTMARVDAKDTLESAIEFDDTDMDLCGVNFVSEVKFYIYASDSESYDTVFSTDELTVRTSIYDEYTQPVDDAGVVIYDSDVIKIVYQDTEYVDWLGYYVVLYLENNSSEDMSVIKRSIYVNGKLVDAHFYCNLLAGTKAVDTITLYSDELEELGIDSVKGVELSFTIYDTSTYDKVVDTKIVSVEF